MPSVLVLNGYLGTVPPKEMQITWDCEWGREHRNDEYLADWITASSCKRVSLVVGGGGAA